jgi:hypothetical protein
LEAEATTAKEIVALVVGAVIGGSGLVGLAFFFLRRYIEKRLNGRDEEEQKRRENRMKRMEIDDKLHHAYGRILFWLYRAIKTGEHNGELEAAFRSLEEAEDEKKNFDRRIIAESEQD